MAHPRCWRSIAILLTGLAFRLPPAAGQPAEPSLPDTIRVELRYRILAGPVQRVPRFNRMVEYLRSIGFHKNKGSVTEAEDAAETFMSGTIGSANLGQILDEPAIFSFLAMPVDWKRPGDPNQPIAVRIELERGLPLDRQQLLAEQTRDRLILLGFQEGIGYDHRRHSRLVGTIPGGELETLLDDVREIPLGWLTPIVALDELPPPIRDVSPIRLVMVMPEPPGFEPGAAPASVPGELDAAGLWKIDPHVLALAGQPAGQNPAVMEVVLRSTPAPLDLSWRQTLHRTVPGLIVLGRLGQIVTVEAPPSSASTLIQLPFVSGIRAPRDANGGRYVVSLPADAAATLDATGLARLHGQGATGQGIRVAIIDWDFRGYEQALPKNRRGTTQYMDFTMLRSSALEPETYPQGSNQLGHGTQCVLVLLKASPDVDLVLVRIDRTAPYQLHETARMLTGEVFRSAGMDLRRAELNAESDAIQVAQDDLLRRRETFLENYGEEADPNKRRQSRFKEPAEQEKERRERLTALDRDQDKLAAQRKEHIRRQERLLEIENGFRSLRGIHLVVSSMVWADSLPLSGDSVLTRYVESLRAQRIWWFQAAGDTRGQTWAGPFRDEDDNGIMEFAPAEQPLRPGRWTPELNFLGWQEDSARRAPELPAGAVLRIGLQWREPHDPEFYPDAGDPYRMPLAQLSLMLLRQRDPTGNKLPADALELVGRTTAYPQRLDNQPDGATYLEELEIKLPRAGHYALRVEGRRPPGIRPLGAASVAAIERNWELTVGLTLDVVVQPTGAQGRPVFLDYVRDYGSLGSPADAQGAFVIGAADLSGQPDAFSNRGSPLGRQLLKKPDWYGPHALAIDHASGPLIAGTSVAAPFAAGTMASILSAGVPPQAIEEILATQHGALIRVPELGRSVPRKR